MLVQGSTAVMRTSAAESSLLVWMLQGWALSPHRQGTGVLEPLHPGPHLLTWLVVPRPLGRRWIDDSLFLRLSHVEQSISYLLDVEDRGGGLLSLGKLSGARLHSVAIRAQRIRITNTSAGGRNQRFGKVRRLQHLGTFCKAQTQ